MKGSWNAFKHSSLHKTHQRRSTNLLWPSWFQHRLWRTQHSCLREDLFPPTWCTRLTVHSNGSVGNCAIFLCITAAVAKLLTFHAICVNDLRCVSTHTCRFFSTTSPVTHTLSVLQKQTILLVRKPEQVSRSCKRVHKKCASGKLCHMFQTQRAQISLTFFEQKGDKSDHIKLWLAPMSIELRNSIFLSGTLLYWTQIEEWASKGQNSNLRKFPHSHSLLFPRGMFSCFCWDEGAKGPRKRTFPCVLSKLDLGQLGSTGDQVLHVVARKGQLQLKKKNRHFQMPTEPLMQPDWRKPDRNQTWLHQSGCATLAVLIWMRWTSWASLVAVVLVLPVWFNWSGLDSPALLVQFSWSSFTGLVPVVGFLWSSSTSPVSVQLLWRKIPTWQRWQPSAVQ